MTRWGLVATVKADRQDVLNFAAYHLDLGADRVSIYLDAPDQPGSAQLAAQLRGQSRVHVIPTDSAWWDRQRGRPAAHQHRQQRNAQHAYRASADLDWLAHIDVDEFLCPARPIPDLLSDVPRDRTTARVRPVEALAGAPGLYKACHMDRRARRCAARRVYPTFGALLPGGFLSHVAGKAFIRTGLAGIRVRIHGIRDGNTLNPRDYLLENIELAHHHATDWAIWRDQFHYRFQKGSYRAALPGSGGLSHHDLFAEAMAAGGEAGLRDVFDEVARATPRHLAALRAEGLLRHHDLQLDKKRSVRFPKP